MRKWVSSIGTKKSDCAGERDNLMSVVGVRSRNSFINERIGEKKFFFAFFWAFNGFL